MKKALALLTVALVLGAVGSAVIELRRPYRGYSHPQLLLIEPGTRAPAIAQLLVERGVLTQRWPFLLRYWVGHSAHSLKAGEYLFDRPMTPLEVYEKLVHGEVYLHSVTFPEGSNRFEMARAVEKQLGIPPEEFLRVTQQPTLVHDLDPRASTLEGYLFPDTYRFPRGASTASVVTAMQVRFRRVLDARLRERLQRSSLSLHDAVTLASLVEKETPDWVERPVVAEVFLRRLSRRWPLQCDPTVAYAARLQNVLIGTPSRPITLRDLTIDSLYNTYRHPGLPPGPICSPGEASIRAVLEPAREDFFYFVSNTHGGHLFARTLAEHQRNVARYRRQVAALRRGRPEVKSRAE